MTRGQRSMSIAAGACVLGAAVVVVATRTRHDPPAPAAPVHLPPGEAARRFLAERASLLPKKVTIDPMAPDYSPDKLKVIADLDVIFEAEPRRASWANAVEAALNPLLLAQARPLEPQLADIRLDCRTTMCALRWTLKQTLGAGREDRFHEIIRQLFPGSGRFRGDSRLVYWSAPEWEKVDVRDSNAFIPAASAHLVKAGQYLASPEGEQRLVRAVVSTRRPPALPAQ